MNLLNNDGVPDQHWLNSVTVLIAHIGEDNRRRFLRPWSRWRRWTRPKG